MRYRLFNTPLFTPTLRVCSRMVLRLFGWRAVGGIPPYIKKCIVIGAPHTSNWDFVIFLTTSFVLGIQAQWMGKHTLFRFPFRGFMTWLGGIPVNRSIRGDLVAKAVAMLNESDELVIGISPEGTRTGTSQWHTGFWHMARNAHVPILLAFIDYPTKQCGFHSEFTPSSDVEEDMVWIKNFYATHFEGKHPHNFKI